MQTKLRRLPVPAMGICFHYYHAANSNQRDQLKQIRDLGFEVINTEESPVEPATPPGPLPPVMAWNHIEIGKNRYDWSFHDHLVEDCEAVGLKLITDVFLPFHLPDWVAEQYGDTDVVAPNGRRWGRYRRHFCGTLYEMRAFSLAHEGAAAAAVDFMGKLADRYKGSATVVGHNLFQELGLNYPHSNPWYGQDVSAPALRGFARFLEERYGALDALCRDWDRSYRDFDAAAADPARFDWEGRAHPGWPLWCEWRNVYMARFFRGMHDAVKAADPEALTTLSAADPYATYSIAQGIDIARMGFVDLVAEKSFTGTQDVMRWMFSWQRAARTDVALSNLNSYERDPPAYDLGRRIFAALGMGSKWNSLYSWSWLSRLDATRGVRVPHDNLKDLSSWIRFMAQRRSLFASARPPAAQVAVLRPGRTDTIEFWKTHDPRADHRSHPTPTEATNGTVRFCGELLGEWSVPYDLLDERTLAERLPAYRLLIIGEPRVSEALVQRVNAWLRDGGKLVLLPNAARFDERDGPAAALEFPFRHQNVAVRSYRDYQGWEADTRFPHDARILLLDRIDGRYIPELLAWAGVEPPLAFVDPPPVPPPGEFGACREAEVARDFHWREHVSVYPLADEAGQCFYVLVRRGQARNLLRDVIIRWSGGPVRVFRPPSLRAVRAAPRDGRLTLPAWRDVAVVVPEGIGLDIEQTQ